MRILFFICWICLYNIFPVCGQEFHEVAKYFNTPESYNGIRGMPTPLDSADLNLIGQFVVRESNRFRMALHPAFAKLDSIAPKGSAKRTELEQNTYAIFPEMAGYRYTPKWKIYRFDNQNNYLRNMYWVEIQDSFSLINTDVKPVLKIPNGHLFSVSRNTYYLYGYGYNSKTNTYDYRRPVFFNNDGIFSVFYCKETGELRMMGGNAFLEQWPEAAIINTLSDYEGASRLFASLRLVHFSGKFPSHTRSRLYYGLNEPDSLGPGVRLVNFEPPYRPYVYFHRSHGRYADIVDWPYYADIVQLKTGRPELDSVPEQQVLLKRGSHNSSETIARVRKEYPTVRVPARPWGPVRLTYYVQKNILPTVKPLLPKGDFFAYEVVHNIVDKPTRYEQLLPKVRGITSDEWNYLKRKDPKLVLNE
jgi:hypothetical protein